MAEERVNVVNAKGEAGTILKSELSQALQQGYRLEAAEETAARITPGEHPIDEALGAVGAFAGGVLDTTSFGLSRAVGEGVGMGRRQREIAEEHPTATLLGNLAGAVNPYGAGGVATAAGRVASGAVKGSGIASRIAAPIVGGVAEGGVFGIGQGFSDVALSENPMNAETILRTVGSNALYGGIAGGVVGAGGALLHEAAVGARDGMRKLAASAVPTAEKRVGEDLLETLARGPAKPSAEVKAAARADAKVLKGTLDDEAAALKTAREGVETEAKAYREELAEATKRFKSDLEKTDSLSRQWRARARSLPEFADDASATRQAYAQLDDAMTETGRFFPAEVRKETVIGKRGAPTAKTRNVYQLKLDDDAIHRVVREQPDALAALQRQRESAVNLLRTINPKTEIGSVDDVFRSADDLTGALTKGADAETRLAQMGERVASPKLEAIERQIDDLEKLYRNDPVRLAKETRKYVDAAEAAGLRATPDDLAAVAKANGLEGVPSAGSEMESVLKAKVYQKAAKAQLSARRGGAARPTQDGGLVSIGVGMAVDTMIDGALGFALGGMAGGLVGRVLRGGLGGMKGKLLKNAMKASGVIAEGIDGLLKSKAPTVARRGATEVGSVLSANSFGDTRRKAKTPQEMLKARAEELAEYLANPVAMEHRLHERLEGIRAVDLKLGDQVWSAAKRKLEFLAAKMPKNPGIGSVTNPDRWRPSEGEIAKFERYVRAADDPLVALDDMRAGRLTPETVETIQAVYPAMYAEIQRTIMETLPQLRAELPHRTRLQLSLFGIDVDSSLRGEFIASMQASPAAEQAQQQAPRPRVPPARKPEATPAQTMAG